MTVYHIMMFIAGGLVSAIIFYPYKKKSHIEFVSYVLAYQFYAGIFNAQQKTFPAIRSLDEVDFIAKYNVPSYSPIAEKCITTLGEL